MYLGEFFFFNSVIKAEKKDFKGFSDNIFAKVLEFKIKKRKPKTGKNS